MLSAVGQFDYVYWFSKYLKIIKLLVTLKNKQCIFLKPNSAAVILEYLYKFPKTHLKLIDISFVKTLHKSVKCHFNELK